MSQIKGCQADSTRRVCANSVAVTFMLHSIIPHPALFCTLHPCIIHSGYMKQSSFEEQCCGSAVFID